VTSPEATSHQQIDELHAEEHHPTPRQYVKVAIILFIVTAAEVAIYYIPALEGLLVPLLLLFAVIKFVLVMLWFMHLRFDSRLFRRLFVTGIVFAVVVFAVVLATFFARDECAFTGAKDEKCATSSTSSE
jgi:cytochrome c oxidase subunit 4